MTAIFHSKFAGDPYYPLAYPHSWVSERSRDAVYELKKAAMAHDIDMRSSGESDIADADMYFFWERPPNDDPVFQYALCSGKPLILLATEPNVVIPENYDASNLYFFSKIFTWLEDQVDGVRYFYFPSMAFSFPSMELTPFDQRQFSTMIASVKPWVRDKTSLYAKRAETVEWFEASHPDDFALYGYKNTSYSGYKVHKGSVSDKLAVMNQYKFCFCYENNSQMQGYISEKIFDCFFAGSVPIYWGSNDNESRIPGDSYISRTDFPTHEALYDYLKSIGQTEYNAYLEAANRFLDTPFAHRYDEKALAKAIIPECIRIKER